ncbi:MAG: NAD(P)/FAD-dependent oxidoreductase [Planctomycetes bacterium]|nr:NAD(P)/FAD-dependent oxidoreductase [Planctomycetota bacterium]
MTHHVIIGGGPVATNAVETIRMLDGGASQITLISDEPAHSRMVLPYWLSREVPREHTYTADDAYFQELNVDAKIGVRAVRLDVTGKSVELSDGSSVSFDDLLLATGSSPISLDIPGADLPGVQPLWSLQHTDQLLKAAESNGRPHVLMIGAGFIGFTLLSAMHKRGWQLSVVERESHVLPRMLDEPAARLVEAWLRARGVQIQCGTEVREIVETSDGKKRVTLASGDAIEADVVVVAVGVAPNLELVQGTDIQVDHGILVNDRLQTNVPFIYAGGDVAQGPALYSDQPAVHAIHPTAVDHGRVAGANMAGQEVHYPGSLLMNILDCCGLQCASFGNWADPEAEAMVISNPGMSIYRKLLWTGDQITGAIFIGRANDMGMLTDVGMIKGILQTQTPLGEWKEFLRENPFDIRRPYVARKVAHKLAGATLLGRPALPRHFHFAGKQPTTTVGPAHSMLVQTKGE